MSEELRARFGDDQPIDPASLPVQGEVSLLMVHDKMRGKPSYVAFTLADWRAQLEAAGEIKGSVESRPIPLRELVRTADWGTWHATASQWALATLHSPDDDPVQMGRAVSLLIFLTCHPSAGDQGVMVALEEKFERHNQVVVIWAGRLCEHGHLTMQVIVDRAYNATLVEEWFARTDCVAPMDVPVLIVPDLLH